MKDSEKGMNNNDYYYISAKLKEAVLNYITGLVLRSYGEEQRARLFFDKSEEYLK